LADDRLPEAALRRVDDVCARFEDAWKKGRRPSLQQFLAGADGPERSELLRELVRLDSHYRRRRGEPVLPDDYDMCFPADVTLIRAVLAEGCGGPDSPTQTARDPLATAPPQASAESTPGAAAGKPGLPVVPGYELLELLGRGGMGVVYKARQTALKRLVALKMIPSADFASPQELTRFRAEAEAIARLRHPNIVQVHEVGEERGCPFFSLEFMEGGSLDRLVRGTPQPPRPAAGLVAVLARAMHVAHQSGVVHRDLKPANVLLSFSRDPEGSAAEALPSGSRLNECVPKIADFGLAKYLDSDRGQTHSGAVIGTPSYMAPEQAAGRVKEVGPAADVYSLAAILYELLTGRPPFKGATSQDTIEQVCTQEPVPVRQLQPSVPRDLETVCLEGLRKDPRQRYASAQDLAGDLQRWLDGRPILARPVPVWERGWKWVRRRPALAGLAAAVVVALVGLATGLVFYALLEHQKAVGGRSVLDDLVSGQRAEEEKDHDFARAKEDYERALATLNAVPGAAGEDVRRQLQEGLQRVNARLKEQAEEQGRLADRQKFEDRRQRFERHADAAALHAVSLGEAEAADAAVVRGEAAAALADLGLAPDRPEALADGLAPYRPLLTSPAELNLVAEECVEVLLAWADAESSAPGPNGGPRRALRLLDGAAALAAAHELAAPRTLHLRRAKCLEQLGDASGAADARRQAGLAPLTAFDRFEEALTSYRAGRVGEASAACAKALNAKHDHFWAHYLKALCHLREQRWGEAEVELGICLVRRPDFPWLLSLRGLAYGGMGDFKKAEADFDNALEHASDPAIRAAILNNRSAASLLQGRPNDAKRDLLQAIGLQPNAYQYYVNLARLLERDGDREGALKQLDQAIERRPDHAALYSLRARLHAENGDRAAARRDFEQVIAREPRGSKSDRLTAARVELVHLRHLAGEDDAALADCDAVIAARPDFAETYRQRAEVLLALKRNKEAGEALDSYLSVGGKPTPEMHRARGLLHAQRHDYRAAVKAYSNALDLKEDAKTLSDRGWAYLMQDAVRPALDDFDAALKHDPNDADALAGRGTALMIRGRVADVAEAVAAAEKSLRPRPWTVPRLMACAGIYARAGGVLEAANDPQAGGCLRRAVALLREAMALVPKKEQAATWRDGVLTDPALRPLQRTAELIELGRAYGP
jgi:tetratricopeptide (TPR) repeat protein